VDNKNLGANNEKKFLFNHFSPDLEKIVYFCNLKSNNHYAESILKTIGLVKLKEGSISAGTKIVTDYWKELGVEIEGLIMKDGSGLSRSNGITALIEAKILQKIFNKKDIYSSFYASLPIYGKTGSLTSMGKGTCLEGKLRAKSGYISRVRAYCGYVKSPDGQTMTFSVIANNYSCKPSDMKNKIEKILECFCGK